jgi:hypothetical protein
MRRLLHLLLALTLLSAQFAAQAHAFSHARHDLDRAAWLHASELAGHGPHENCGDAPASFLGGDEHGPVLDHGKDRCMAFIALDCSMVLAGLSPEVAAPAGTTVRSRSWWLFAAERVPFSSRAPPFLFS